MGFGDSLRSVFSPSLPLGMNDEILVTKSQYDDFSQPTSVRNFEIIVEGFSLYLNAGWLSELSAWFADYCYGAEPRLRLHVDDISYLDMLEFFRCIFFCPMRKPLTVHNVALVLRCANRFEMRPVIARCDRFITQNALTLDRKKLFQVTCAMSRCDPNSSTMSVLVDRLASIKEEDLSELQFDKMPGDVVADVYREKIRRRRRQTDSWFCPLNWFNSLGRRKKHNQSELHHSRHAAHNRTAPAAVLEKNISVPHTPRTVPHTPRTPHAPPREED